MNHEDHWCKGFKLWGKKALELERVPTGDVSEADRILTYSFDVKIKRRMDHAGVTLMLRTPSEDYILSFYDVRHWDRESEDWKPLS